MNRYCNILLARLCGNNKQPPNFSQLKQPRLYFVHIVCSLTFSSATLPIVVCLEPGWCRSRARRRDLGSCALAYNQNLRSQKGHRPFLFTFHWPVYITWPSLTSEQVALPHPIFSPRENEKIFMELAISISGFNDDYRFQFIFFTCILISSWNMISGVGLFTDGNWNASLNGPFFFLLESQASSYLWVSAVLLTQGIHNRFQDIMP